MPRNIYVKVVLSERFIDFHSRKPLGGLKLHFNLGLSRTEYSVPVPVPLCPTFLESVPRFSDLVPEPAGTGSKIGYPIQLLVLTFLKNYNNFFMKISNFLMYNHYIY